MEFLFVLVAGSLFALTFTAYGMFSKKDWSYGNNSYNGEDTQRTFRIAFVVIVILFALLWFAGSNNPG